MKLKTSIEQYRTGRPLKFAPEEMQKKIDDYFQDCEKNNRAATISGLAVELGTSRTLLARYKGMPLYEAIIANAKARIEALIEEGMLRNRLNTTACIFTLKNNYGWSDQQTIRHEGVIYQIAIKAPTDVMFDAELLENNE